MLQCAHRYQTEQLRAVTAEAQLEQSKRVRAQDELARAEQEILRLKSLHSEGRALSDISQKVAKEATLDQAALSSEKHRLQGELDEARKELQERRTAMRSMEKDATLMKDDMHLLQATLQQLLTLSSDKATFNQIATLADKSMGVRR